MFVLTIHMVALSLIPFIFLSSRKRKKSANQVASPVMPDTDWLKMLYSFIHFRTNGVTSFDRESSNPGEAAMACWIEEQNRNRRELKAGGLDDSLVHEQIAVLDSIRFPFERSQPERRDANLTSLREFKEEHGHLNVPQRIEGGLGKYVARLRQEYKLPPEQRVCLTSDLVEELNNMGFAWAVKKSNAQAWAEKFSMFVQWKENNGHCKVPRNEPVLGKWVADQRSKKKSNKLTDDQVEKLNGIGFIWEAR